MLPQLIFVPLSKEKSMTDPVLQLTSQPIGKGRERTCYLHPEDPSKIIKISGEITNVQSKREIGFYRKLQKISHYEYTHIPRFYGSIKTSLGEGIVVDLIRDYEGSISKSLRWYLVQGTPISEFESYLSQLKQYLLENLVIFNHDMGAGNLLYQKLSKDSARLVMIDGIGDVIFIQWLNYFPSQVRSKINRRWDRFIKRLYSYPEVIRHLDN